MRQLYSVNFNDLLGMSTSSEIKKVSYLCEECGRTRNLNIDKEVHLQRRELEVNGLASYIDVHADKNGEAQHGIKMFIDKNFHVRTNNVLKIKGKSAKKSNVPMPGFKTKNITTKFDWKSWEGLELELKTENLRFQLELDRETDDDESIKPVIAKSALGSVTCSIQAIVDQKEQEKLEYMHGWIKALCDALELASSIHIDLIPEILRHIDLQADRRMTYSDQTIISILIDKSSILIPDHETMEMIGKYGPAMTLIGINPEKLSNIAQTLIQHEQFSMIDVQHILEEEMEKDSELEEEFIVLALFYLLSLDAFDYKLSYLQTNQEKPSQ